MTSTTSRRGRRALLAASAALALVTGAAVTAAPVAAAPPDDRIPGSWIVTLVDGPSPQAVADEHRRDYGADVAYVYRHALHGYAARMSDAAVERISRDTRVRSVVADRTVSIAKPGGKPGGGGGGTVQPPPQELPTGIKRIGAVGKVGSSAVTVAVIDTGIDGTHPDLSASIDKDLSKNCSSGNSWSDGNGHGTHVAGTIGAIDNTEGVIGVAPGVKLAAIRVLNNAGSGSWSSIICGLDWVKLHSASIQIANMSLGGGGSDSACGGTDALRNAVCAVVNAGVTVVVAAGNASDDAKNHVPAAYDDVITVSALADFDGAPGGGATATCRADVDDTFADFSNHGTDVDLIAPGVCILSTWKGGGYNTISGTSMASPHVAGAAALWISQQESRPSVAAVRTALDSAANLTWDDGDDPDEIKEKLVGVGSLTTSTS